MTNDTHEQTSEAEVRTAFADANPQDGEAAYTGGMRCLSFLTSAWLDPEVAKRTVQYIGPYNQFDPDVTGRMLDRLPGDAMLAVGREGSPVLYVQTHRPEAAKGAFNTHPGHSPDVLREVEPTFVGSARSPIYGQSDGLRDPHSACDHESPPVPVEEYAPTDDSARYVRAWWD